MSSGLEGTPQASDVTGVQVGTDFTPTGRFECSYEPFNRIQEIFLRTLHNYVIHLPNDPVREKAGWDQDIWNQFECTAYNFDCLATYAEWQRDLIEEQHANGYVPPVVPSRFDGPTINGPWWGGSIVYNPWLIYRFYGDRRVLGESYPAMKSQVGYLESIAKDGVVSWGLGDWLEVGSVRPVMTPVPFTSTAAYAWFTRLVARSAEILGPNGGSRAVQGQGRGGRRRFQPPLLQRRHRRLRQRQPDEPAAAVGAGADAGRPDCESPTAAGRSGPGEEGPSEHRLRRNADPADRLVRQRAGRVGLANCHPARLSRLVRHALQPRQHGDDRRRGTATACRCRRWPGRSAPGFIVRWPAFAPITEQPGFKHVIIHPAVVGELKWVRAHHDSPYGRISVEWKRAGDRFTMDVVIPPNTTATVYLPTPRPNEVSESGKPARDAVGVTPGRAEGDAAVFVVQSGHYHFAAPMEKAAAGSKKD